MGPCGARRRFTIVIRHSGEESYLNNRRTARQFFFFFKVCGIDLKMLLSVQMCIFSAPCSSFDARTQKVDVDLEFCPSMGGSVPVHAWSAQIFLITSDAHFMPLPSVLTA